jgi:tetratricopeptide repeat protein
VRPPSAPPSRKQILWSAVGSEAPHRFCQRSRSCQSGVAAGLCHRTPRTFARSVTISVDSDPSLRKSRSAFHVLLWILILSLLCPGAGRAQSALSMAFDAANKLYEEGKFTEAAQAYERMLKSGQVGPALWFNVGNAYFKSGQIGRALAAYLQAERITPRDPDVRANLQFARNQTQGPTQVPSRWHRWLGRLTLNEWTLLSAGAFWLWLLVLGLRQWRPTLKPGSRGLVVALGLATLLAVAGLGADWREVHLVQTAIVVTPEVTVHHGPLDESPTAFTAHDGAEFEVLDRKDQWLEISAGQSRIGWVRQDQVLLPPRG